MATTSQCGQQFGRGHEVAVTDNQAQCTSVDAPHRLDRGFWRWLRIRRVGASKRALMSLRRQAASLAVMHAIEVLQPLIILPYAGRVLGPLYFGQYAYVTSIGQLAATIVEYGFHWTGQRAAASARQDPGVIASLLADVVATKTVLCLLLTSVGLLAADNFLPVSRSMFLCAMLTSVGNFVPAWLFIALERAWQAALAVVIAGSWL